jgi:stage III sporulation protein SpoIIIAA
LFPVQLRSLFHKVIDDYQEIREIRIRRNGPVHIIINNAGFYLNETGDYLSSPYAGMMLNEKDFNELFSHICRHSVYAFEKDFINGYLTVEG